MKDVLKNGMCVSTVPPNRFADEWETMVFPSENNYLDLFCWRYDSEEDAYKGHDIVVALLNSRVMEEE